MGNPIAIRVIDDITQLAADGFNPGDIPEWNGAQFVPGSAASDIADLTAAAFSAGKIPRWDGVSFAPVDYVSPAVKIYMATNFR